MNPSHHSMFWRVWLRSLAVKRPQSVLAFAALALGATVASLLLNVYGDAQRKMQREFRAYGANVVVAPGAGDGGATTDAPGAPGGLIDAATAARLEAAVRALPSADSSLVAVPVLYALASAATAGTSSAAAESSSLIAVGADFATLRALNPAWRLTGADGRPALAGEDGCVFGAHAAERLGLVTGERATLTFGSAGPAEPAGRELACTVSGVIASGAAEDDQVFAPLRALQRASGLEGSVSLMEIRVPGAAENVAEAVHDLQREFAGLDVREVREIVQSEGSILHTLRALVVSLAALIVGVVALCVMATVTTIVLERRKEVAVMKALGATDRTVLTLLLTEIGALGAAGGLVGFAAGVVLARRLGVDLFGVPLNPAWWTMAPVLACSLLVAALPALLPASMVRSVDPARSLRGE